MDVPYRLSVLPCTATNASVLMVLSFRLWVLSYCNFAYLIVTRVEVSVQLPVFSGTKILLVQSLRYSVLVQHRIC